MLEWLLGAVVGPAAFALPVNWGADALAGAAQRWFKRLRRTDDLSRLVRAATGTSVDLAHAEFDAVRERHRTGMFTMALPEETARAVLGMLQSLVRWYNPDGPLT